jgi:hypothetical protein
MRQQVGAFPNTYLPETDISQVFHTPNAFILEHIVINQLKDRQRFIADLDGVLKNFKIFSFAPIKPCACR